MCCFSRRPHTIGCRAQRPPLVVGTGGGRGLGASDTPPFSATRETWVRTAAKWSSSPFGRAFSDFCRHAASPETESHHLGSGHGEKGRLRPLQLKEIYEQRGRERDGTSTRSTNRAASFSTRCRSSRALPDRERLNSRVRPRHACGLVGKFLIEQGSRGCRSKSIRLRIRYPPPIVGREYARRGHYQSGETADTLRRSRSALARRAESGDLQRCRQHGLGGEREAMARLYDRRPGDRRRVHESVHVTTSSRCN